MGYYIIANNYAKKIKNCNPYEKSHAVLVNYCNFQCDFCAIDYAGRNLYHDYDEESFCEKIDELLKLGRSFKFSGGEPTLNTELEKHLSIVKSKGGEVYLDTNGSNFEIIKKLIDRSLVDVLGVSIKGLSYEEASLHSKVQSKDKCWDNVLKTIKYAASKGNAQVIVTLVCFDDFSYVKALDFYNLFKGLNVVYKFNNYKKNNDGVLCGLKRCDPTTLDDIISRLINDVPDIKGKIVLIDDERAVFDYDKIRFL